jgi:hypothetical protein
VQERVFQQWNINGTGPLATNGIEAGVKIRPTEEELTMMDKWPCPEFRSGWDSYFKDKPDKPVMHYSVIAGWFGDHMVMPPGKFFTMFRKKASCELHVRHTLISNLQTSLSTPSRAAPHTLPHPTHMRHQTSMPVS